MTHWDPSSNEAYKIYADTLHSLMVEAANGNSGRGSALSAVFHILEGTRYGLETTLAKSGANQLKPTGYVVDCLEYAIYALQEGSDGFEKAVIKCRQYEQRCRHDCGYLRGPGGGVA